MYSNYTENGSILLCKVLKTRKVNLDTDNVEYQLNSMIFDDI